MSNNSNNNNNAGCVDGGDGGGNNSSGSSDVHNDNDSTNNYNVDVSENNDDDDDIITSIDNIKKQKPYEINVAEGKATNMLEEYNNIHNCVEGLEQYCNSLEGKFSSKNCPDPIGFAVLKYRSNFSTISTAKRKKK